MRPELTWRVAREGWALGAALLVLAVVTWMAGLGWLALASLLAGLAILAFFRDPERQGPAGPDLVLSPADGRVVAVAPPADGTGPAVTIFLSVFNVHINRIPIGGRVAEVERTTGRFRAAFRSDASVVNERVAVTIETPRGTVRCVQIAGVLARRIVCRVRPGDVVETGQRYGLIQFGSRMDILLPSGAEILTATGARTRAAVTPIARLAGGPVA